MISERERLTYNRLRQLGMLLSQVLTGNGTLTHLFDVIDVKGAGCCMQALGAFLTSQWLFFQQPV